MKKTDLHIPLKEAVSNQIGRLATPGDPLKNHVRNPLLLQGRHGTASDQIAVICWSLSEDLHDPFVELFTVALPYFN